MNYRGIQKDLEQIFSQLVSRHERRFVDNSIGVEEASWIDQDNIQGFSIGYRERKGQTIKNEWVIQVLVAVKGRPANELYEIPKFILSENSNREIALDVLEVGEFECTALDYRKRPCPGGFAVSRRDNNQDGNKGTIGCLVKDRNNKIFLLSCSHVLAGHSNHKFGDLIYQHNFSGASDHDERLIARLYQRSILQPSSTYSTLLDAAIAQIRRPIIQNVDPEIIGIGEIGGVAPSTPVGSTLLKVGFKTEYTSGVYKGKKAHLRVKVKFADVTFFTGFANQRLANYNSKSGDSGALVLNSRQKAVGLHFAISNKGYAVFTPIIRVLNHFEVRLVKNASELLRDLA